MYSISCVRVWVLGYKVSTSIKLAWSVHVTRRDSLSKTTLQGTLEGGRRRGRQRKCWMDNIKEWTSLPMPELLTRASRRKDWKIISAESSLMSPWRPNRSRDWTELNRNEWVGDTKTARFCFKQVWVPWNLMINCFCFKIDSCTEAMATLPHVVRTLRGTHRSVVLFQTGV